MTMLRYCMGDRCVEHFLFIARNGERAIDFIWCLAAVNHLPGHVNPPCLGRLSSGSLSFTLLGYDRRRPSGSPAVRSRGTGQWGASHESVLAIGLTSFDQRQPSSKVNLSTSPPPTPTTSALPWGNVRTSRGSENLRCSVSCISNTALHRRNFLRLVTYRSIGRR
jgi:hypothetical protein